MNKATKNNIQTALIVLPFLLLATVMNRFPPDLNTQIIRGSIHISLLVAWEFLSTHESFRFRFAAIFSE